MLLKSQIFDLFAKSSIINYSLNDQLFLYSGEQDST